MRRNCILLKILMSCLVLFLVQTRPSQGQWSDDPTENNCVTNAPGDQKNSCIVYDGLGNVIIGWRDLQFTSNVMLGGEIYAQKFNAEGIIQWDTNGIPVNYPYGGDSHADAPGLVKSNDGTVIAVWMRWGNSWYDPTKIFAQKIGGDGTRLWENNIQLFGRSGGQGWVALAPDPSGGVIVTCMYADGKWNKTPKDIIAQRVSSSGEIMWLTEGIDICTADNDQLNPSVACGADGYTYVVWSDERNDEDGDIYAQKIDSSGMVQWESDGRVISANNHSQVYPVVISDGKGGAIFVWVQTTGNSERPLYAQRVDKGGSFVWGTDGILIQANTILSPPAVVSDGIGGAIIAWPDIRGEDIDIYAQRIDSSGVKQWGDEGIAVTKAPGRQSDLAVISDGEGGIIAAWSDFRSDPNYGDIYAQRISGNGTALWQKNGVAVSIAAGQQLYPSLATDGEGGAMIVWDDIRVGTMSDVYAQHLTKDGYAGVFKDQDGDGISDAEEQGPQGTDPAYDGNGDDTPDVQQNNVASFYTYDREHYVTLSVSDSLSLENVKPVATPDPQAPGAPPAGSAPYGFFSFTITGLHSGSHTVATLLLDGMLQVDHYYKYGPESGQQDHWYDFSYDGETGAEINSDTISLYLTDGKRGDHDLSANGTIKDPGGPLLIASFAGFQGKEKYSFKSIRPNPAVESARITFFVPQPCNVRIDVYDITGKKVICLLDKPVSPGEHSVNWLTGDMTPELYILKMTAAHHSVVRKLIISR